MITTFRKQTDVYANAQGYGILCGKKCIAKKKADAAALAAKEQRDLDLLKQVSASTSSQGWTAGQITGMAVGSLAAVGLLIFALKKIKSKG